MAARKPTIIRRACSTCERAAIERQRWKKQVQQEFKDDSPKFRVPKRNKPV